MPERTIVEGLHLIVGSFSDTPGLTTIRKNALYFGIEDS